MAARPKKGEATPSIATLWRSLFADLFDPYRPELHYMRGPGPKWREKHLPKAPEAQAAPGAMAEATA